MYITFCSFNNNKYVFTNNNDIFAIDEGGSGDFNAAELNLHSKNMIFPTLTDIEPQIVIIEVTTRCNFRCEYCVYSGNYLDRRTHGSQTISENQIDRIVEFVQTHKSVQYVTFYGGEPLLAIDEIKIIVSKLGQAGFSGEYGFTTNGELLRMEDIEYFEGKNFHILVSFDGVNHSKYRKCLTNPDAPKQLIQRLQDIRAAYPDYYYTHIGFSITLTPPYNLLRNAHYFNESPLFNKNQLLVSFVESDTFWEQMTNHSHAEQERTEAEYDILMHEYCNQTEKSPFHKALFDSEMRKILCRREPMAQDIEMNGCCIPGNRRVFFALSGEIYPCEKVGIHTVLGTWGQGEPINYTAEVLCKQYYDTAKEICKNCWLSNMCDSCFAQLSVDKCGEDKKMNIRCADKKIHMKRMLSLFVSCLESNEQSLDYLLDDEIM